MNSVFSNWTPLPRWAIVLALLTLTPLPLTLPSGIAMAAIALTGWLLVLHAHEPRPHAPLAQRARRAWAGHHVHPG